MQIQITWLLKKPTDLDLHCLQRQGLYGFSRTKVKINGFAKWFSVGYACLANRMSSGDVLFLANSVKDGTKRLL